jgi:hypothetical protein
MRLFRFAAIGAAAVFACCLAAAAQDVHTDFDHHVDFQQFRTYSWSRVHTDNPLWEPRIQRAVDQQLQSKGWQRLDSGGQASISAVGAVHNQQEYTTFYNGMGDWHWGGFGPQGQATTTVDNERVGTLVVDLYDTGNKQLIWRGEARDTLSDNPQKNEKKLQKVADKMFKKFPPEEGGK